MKPMILLLSLLGLTAVFLTACEAEPDPIPATVAELCTLEANTWVRVEGQFSLPTFLTCQEGKCRLNFGGGGSGIMADMRTSDTPRANMLKLPPDQFADDDLSFVLDDETVGDRHTVVSVMGRVKRPSETSCYLDVSSISLP
ncbi:MAG: hypothetical protein WAS33_12445 [Candidatus Promineifilaceae bacterium]|nr:hypothetical protein [Anaerolineaceae bacterium]